MSNLSLHFHSFFLCDLLLHLFACQKSKAYCKLRVLPKNVKAEESKNMPFIQFYCAIANFFVVVKYISIQLPALNFIPVTYLYECIVLADKF